MNGIVQIRAGKPVVVDASGVVLKALPGATDFLAEDVVTLADPVRLVARKRIPAVGVVKGFSAAGVLLAFPAHPVFQTSAQISERVSRGDRVVVVLESTGAVTVVDCFSGGATDDHRILQRLYSLVDWDTPFRAGVAGTPRYSGGLCDLTALDTFTVDPQGSVDLDDAISIDEARRHLYVHIVDIHRALTPALEERMFRHASTLYLPGDTVHLLPTDLVSSLSLDAGKQRHAITVKMTLETGGGWDIQEFSVFPSLIRVDRRMNYDELYAVRSEAPYAFLGAFAESHADKLPLDLPGLVVSEGVPKTVASNDCAHRMVACAMIAANFAVSAHLITQGLTIPQRFHEAPCGLFKGDVVPITGNSVVDSYLAVKKWRPAVYDLERKGHFGLGLETYVHFTSPLRRYADVLVHRILAGVVYDPVWLSGAVDALNARAKFVRGLHKQATGLAVARYLTANPHALTQVYLTAVCHVGVSWYSPQFLINGFTHVSKLGTRDRWDFQDGVLRAGEHRRAVGDVCSVARVEYNIITGIYDLEIALPT
jgi:hypothetical protein